MMMIHCSIVAPLTFFFLLFFSVIFNGEAWVPSSPNRRPPLSAAGTSCCGRTLRSVDNDDQRLLFSPVTARPAGVGGGSYDHHHPRYTRRDLMLGRFGAPMVAAAVSPFLLMIGTSSSAAATEEEQQQAAPEKDPFAAFGEQLQQQQNWSPGSNYNNAATVSSSGDIVGSDMEQALKQAKKKKQVDPRTHG